MKNKLNHILIAAFTLLFSAACSSVERELISTTPTLSPESLRIEVGQIATVEVLNAEAFSAMASGNGIIALELRPEHMEFDVEGISEGVAAVKVKCDGRPAPLSLPVEVYKFSGLHSFDDELLDSGPRFVGCDAEIRFQTGGVVFERRHADSGLRIVRLSDGMTVVFSPGIEISDGMLPDARLTINGAVCPLVAAQRVESNGSTRQFYNLTSAITGNQIVLVY